MPKYINKAAVAQAKRNKEASEKYGGPIKETKQKGIYKVDTAKAVEQGVIKSVKDVARIPMRIAKRLTSTGYMVGKTVRKGIRKSNIEYDKMQKIKNTPENFRTNADVDYAKKMNKTK